MLRFDDDEGARRLELNYMTPDIVAQRAAVRAALALQPGERVLDVGAGPGFLTAEMAEEVGSDGAVHGIDPSESMLEMARRRAPGPPAAPVELRPGGAEALPYDDGTFDAVVSTQVLEYVDDVPGALAETHRVLREGGRVLVLDTDWSTLRIATGDAPLLSRVLDAWDEHLADAHLPRRLPALLADAGFALARTQVVPLVTRGYDPDTYAAWTIRTIAAFVAGRRGITEAEAEGWAGGLEARGEAFDFRLDRELFIAVR